MKEIKLLLKDPEDGAMLSKVLNGDRHACMEFESQWLEPIRQRIAQLSFWKRWKANRLLKGLLRQIQKEPKTLTDKTLFWRLDTIDATVQHMTPEPHESAER